jgi:hypothetical protein
VRRKRKFKAKGEVSGGAEMFRRTLKSDEGRESASRVGIH